MMYTKNKERGAVSGLLVSTVALGVLFVAAASFAIWSYVEYNDAKSDVDTKIEAAVLKAKAETVEDEQKKSIDREKLPNSEFNAPDDYCGLRFKYPRTWSAYESEKLTNGGTYRAYLHPRVIPYIDESTQLALRVTIEQKDYDQVIDQYRSLIQKGTLKSSTTSSQGKSGQRITGDFSKNIRGDAVIFRCRDKTITIRTDAESTFKNDFEAIIRTIDFND